MEMLLALKAFLAAKAGIVAGSAVLGMGLMFLPKMINGWIDRKVGGFLDGQLLSLDNPDDQRFAFELIRWVEKKVPDAGKGKEKADLAAGMIVRIFPPLKKHKEKLSNIIESAVYKLNEELKERSAHD